MYINEIDPTHSNTHEIIPEEIVVPVDETRLCIEATRRIIDKFDKDADPISVEAARHFWSVKANEQQPTSDGQSAEYWG